MIKMRTVNVGSTGELARVDCSDCDILMVNYQKEIVFASYYEIPQPIKVSRAMSFDSGTVITLCAKLRIEDDRYCSVAVFDKGIFLGISDALTEKETTAGKCQKVYTTGAGKFGVCVGTDFLCAQAENCVCGGADFIIHQTFDKFGCEYMCAVKGHSVFGTEFVGLYADTALKSDGRTVCVPIGETFEFKNKILATRPPVNFLKLSRIE